MKAGKIWGQTELLHANGVLVFHRIEFKKGYECSEHLHEYKWNGFYVEKGELLIRVWQDGDQDSHAQGDEPPGVQHRVPPRPLP